MLQFKLRITRIVAYDIEHSSTSVIDTDIHTVTDVMVLCANASLLNEQKSTSRKLWCILTKSRCAVQLPHPSLQDVQLRKTIEEMKNIVLSTKTLIAATTKYTGNSET